nr:ATP-binding cassette domain-containing protein [uncultured Shimia sp.]
MVETALFPLTLSEATVRKSGVTLVGPVDLEIGPIGTTVVIGPNGAGKSTLLRLMHGLDRAAKGRVDWNVPMKDAQNRQGFVFQTPILMRRSVVDCIAYPLLVHGVSRKDAHAQALDWADRVGLADHAARPARTLSGGERQKMALARALIRNPDILFLDEPCASLDGSATREIEGILKSARTANTRMVMATHDMGQAKRLADDVLFIYRGKVHEHSTAEAFFKAPQTPEAQAFLRGDILE